MTGPPPPPPGRSKTPSEFTPVTGAPATTTKPNAAAGQAVPRTKCVSQSGAIVPMPERSRTPSQSGPTASASGRHPIVEPTDPDKVDPDKKESLAAQPEVLSASIDAAFIDDEKTSVRSEPLP